MPSTISERQQAICACILTFVEVEGWPPSMRELGMLVGMPSTSHVDYHLNALVRKDLLVRKSGNRRIRLTPSGREVAEAYLARTPKKREGAA